jgi:hypothetical protein
MFGILYRDLFPPFFLNKNNLNSHIYDRPRHSLGLPLVVAIFVTAQPTFESRHLMAINA